MAIHRTAIVAPSAEIDSSVEIGPYSIIGARCHVGAGTRIGPHVVLEDFTSVGERCEIRAGACLGGPPQDVKFKGEESYLRIGDNNIIREFVTIHRATGAGATTVIGDDGMFMAYCHVGHNCHVGNAVIMASWVGISGHVVIEDKVTFGGMVGVHQFVRIGRLAMIGAQSKVVQDIPPFMKADGRPTKVYTLNDLGLRRSGLSAKVRSDLKQAFKLLYLSDLNLSQAIEEIEQEIDMGQEISYLLDFLRSTRFGYGGRQMDHRPE
ncbi:MAG TPA: acyl-ACP--UDP-N-acetylglucosamine O-acyltransferase [Armatimonadota bacterium]|nr:acyl-ACP--UDP-N-acetylglucosamine O-acyltransferase [Armatimonadota bacterium]